MLDSSRVLIVAIKTTATKYIPRTLWLLSTTSFRTAVVCVRRITLSLTAFRYLLFRLELTTRGLTEQNFNYVVYTLCEFYCL